jgi:hypothetical protein
MPLDDDRDAEILESLEHLETLVPVAGAHLTLGEPGGARTIAGNRSGYMRLGLALIRASLAPIPATGDTPARIEPDLRGLLTSGSPAPFESYELDESIGSRPPVESPIHPVLQLLAGVVAVAVIIAAFVAVAFVVRWILG